MRNRKIFNCPSCYEKNISFNDKSIMLDVEVVECGHCGKSLEVSFIIRLIMMILGMGYLLIAWWPLFIFGGIYKGILIYFLMFFVLMNIYIFFSPIRKKSN